MKCFSTTAIFLALAVSALAETPTATITSAPFGKTDDGAPITIYTLRNASGMEARIMDFGGVIVSLKVPDRKGAFADVVLGYDAVDRYLSERHFYGAILGRYAGRIGAGKFDLEGGHYQLNTYGRDMLHGGYRGFDRVLWKSEAAGTKEGPTVKLTYLSKDGEEGFPGNLTVNAVYTLTAKNELRLDFTATTDKPTVINFSNHSYFNLAGQGEGNILAHVLQMNAGKVLVINDGRLPTGETRDVAGTPLDFRKPTAIGARIDADFDQITFAHGYDNYWIFDKKPGELALMARVVEPKSGRVMEVLSTEPGLQFYAGVNIEDDTGKGGKAYTVHSAFCMEAGHYPDSPNHPEFPTTELKPGDTFHSTIIYRFSTDKDAVAEK
ncbi:MAG TPA: aldose epimerase family protein [Chthoniobacteraceae bacterium]|nr:aldose epimerase family protein [Chthoniobacteraceae bacterium]